LSLGLVEGIFFSPSHWISLSDIAASANLRLGIKFNLLDFTVSRHRLDWVTHRFLMNDCFAGGVL